MLAAKLMKIVTKQVFFLYCKHRYDLLSLNNILCLRPFSVSQFLKVLAKIDFNHKKPSHYELSSRKFRVKISQNRKKKLKNWQNKNCGCNVEFDPTGVLLTFFQCTMVQNIHGIGKNLKLNTWEILTHPNILFTMYRFFPRWIFQVPFFTLKFGT